VSSPEVDIQAGEQTENLENRFDIGGPNEKVNNNTAGYKFVVDLAGLGNHGQNKHFLLDNGNAVRTDENHTIDSRYVRGSQRRHPSQIDTGRRE
jgi:hypothetical protein